MLSIKVSYGYKVYNLIHIYALSPLLFIIALEFAISRSRKIRQKS
jgi:hypothetical protein